MRVRLLIMLFVLAAMGAKAQLAVKTNLLYDATTTPNVGLEYAFGMRNTIQLVYGLNPWVFNSETHGKRDAKHWVLMPEYRRWLCSKFNGHFFGVHAMGGEFNASNVSLPIPGAFFGGENITRGVRDRRYQGDFIGIGATYGYQWILGKHWNLEAEVGVGYGHVWYDKFLCGTCGNKLSEGTTNYVGITKLGISILYLF